MELHYFMQASVSIIQNSEVVGYSGAANVCLLLGRGQLLGVSVNREFTVYTYQQVHGTVGMHMIVY